MPYFDTMFTLALRLRRVGLGLWYVGIILVESGIMSKLKSCFGYSTSRDFGANARTLQARQRELGFTVSALTLG